MERMYKQEREGYPSRSWYTCKWGKNFLIFIKIIGSAADVTFSATEAFEKRLVFPDAVYDFLFRMFRIKSVTAIRTDKRLGNEFFCVLRMSVYSVNSPSDSWTNDNNCRNW